MGDGNGSRIVLQRQLDDFSRMYPGAVDGAAEKLLVLDEPMAFVEIRAAKHFVL